MFSTVHHKHYLISTLFKKVLIVTASLIISGYAVTSFDNKGVLQKSTSQFMTAVPPECAGKAMTYQCWLDNNPERR
jgi:hypothetical protein